MKSLLGVLLIGGLLWAGAARTDGNSTQKREVAPFQEIELRGNLAAEIVSGDSLGLTLEGDFDALEKTASDVRNGRLVVTAPGGMARRAVRALVTLPRLESIAILDAAQASLRGFSGPHLGIVLDGAASIVAQGVFNSYDLSASGASIARLAELEARVAFIRLDTASRALIAPMDQLRGVVSNASRATYLGDRASARVDVDITSRIDYRRER